MALYVNTFFEKRVEQLFDLAGRVEAAFAAAGLEYCVIGGLAVYLYVEEAEPDAPADRIQSSRPRFFRS